METDTWVFSVQLGGCSGAALGLRKWCFCPHKRAEEKKRPHSNSLHLFFYHPSPPVSPLAPSKPPRHVSKCGHMNSSIVNGWEKGKERERRQRTARDMRERERERVSTQRPKCGQSKGKTSCCSGLHLNGMIYSDVVTDELSKVVYEYTSLHISLSAPRLSLLSSADSRGWTLRWN